MQTQPSSSKVYLDKSIQKEDVVPMQKLLKSTKILSSSGQVGISNLNVEAPTPCDGVSDDSYCSRSKHILITKIQDEQNTVIRERNNPDTILDSF